MNVVKYFVFIIFLSNACADYLECYICEDCEENEGYFEYCPMLEEYETSTQLVSGTTQTADSITLTTDADAATTVQEHNITNAPLRPTISTVIARPISVNTTQTTISVTASNYSTSDNATSLISSNETINEPTTVDEASENTLDPNDSTTFTTEVTIDSSTEQTTLEAENLNLSILNGTESTTITGLPATTNTTENLTSTYITETLQEVSNGNNENVTNFENTTMGVTLAIDADIGIPLDIGEVVEDEDQFELNQTTTEIPNTTNPMNQTSTEIPMNNLESMEMNWENLTDFELETTIEAAAENITENSMLNTTEFNSVLENLTTAVPEKIPASLEIQTTDEIQEAATSSMEILNSTESLNVNVKNILGSIDVANEVLANTAGSIGANGSIGNASGNFENITIINGPNNTADILELIGTMDGIIPITIGSERPNGTAYVGMPSQNNGTLANITSSDRPNDKPQPQTTEPNDVEETGTGTETETGTMAENAAFSLSENNSMNLEVVNLNATNLLEFTDTTNESLGNETAAGAAETSSILENITTKEAESITTTETATTLEIPISTSEMNTSDEAGMFGTTNLGTVNATTQLGITTENGTSMEGSTDVEVGDETGAEEDDGDRSIIEELNSATRGNISSANVTLGASLGQLLEDNSLEFDAGPTNGVTQIGANTSNVTNNPTGLSVVINGTSTTGNVQQNEDSIINGYSGANEDFSNSLIESFERSAVPRSEVNTVNKALNAKNSVTITDFQRNAAPQLPNKKFPRKLEESEFRSQPTRFSPHKYSKMVNSAGMRQGNITYKCYTVRIKGQNKRQINKGCVAVPADKTACELLAQKYGEGALEDCTVCLKGKCNRSQGNGLGYSAISLALIMVIGWVLSERLS